MIQRMTPLRLISTAVTLLAAAAPVWAQQKIGKAPDPDKPWLVVVVSAVLLIVVLVGSFKPSKRGHRD